MYVDTLVMYSSRLFHFTNKIGHNQLTGLPSEIGNLWTLKKLDIGKNVYIFIFMLTFIRSS